ncbi:MAG: hypothetical protein HW388_326 [Dehalococcoidia bacterium]|nr:hypothetical protein [Dehalococcoidia bacterium]
MANAVVALLLVAFTLFGVTLMAQGSFVAMNQVSDGWKQMEERSVERAHTEMEVLDTGGTPFLEEVTLRNSGSTPLRDFEKWDVIVQYYQSDGTYHQRWLSYTEASPPGDNQWTIAGIYVDAGASQAEIFQPGILDSAEEMVIQLKLSPAARSSGNQVIIGTPNGISVVTSF